MADKKKQRKLEQQQQSRLQKQRQVIVDHKERMMPLVKFLKKEGLNFRYARVGQNRIEYFRVDEFLKLKEDKKEKIEKNENIQRLFNEAKNDFIYFKRPADLKNLKYPPVLEPVAESDPNAKFSSFKFDTTISKKWTMLGLVAGVLALVLFPVWPYILKYSIWLISLYLLIILVGLLIIRLAIYLVCVVLGYNVWILPNLLGDYGFIDSFRPFFYYERWQKSTMNIIIRIVAFVLVVYCGAQIYLDPTFLRSNLQTTKATIDDIHDWGVSKIKNEVQFSERAITNLEDILNETADVEDNNTGQAGADGEVRDQSNEKEL